MVGVRRHVQKKNECIFIHMNDIQGSSRDVFFFFFDHHFYFPAQLVGGFTLSDLSGCVRREIPGVTQVDEKGHEGNTAVATVLLRVGS